MDIFLGSEKFREFINFVRLEIPRVPFRVGSRVRSLIRQLYLFFLVLSLAGCTAALTPLGPNRQPDREDENFQDFMDVPYPSIMVVEKKDVEVFTRRGVLSGRVPLMGPLATDEIMDYFDRHLPRHGWQPQAEVVTGKTVIATWTKPGKTLTIIATSPSLTLKVNSKVELWVAPPHRAEDLGRRTIYRSSEETPKPFQTTPIFRRGEESGVYEENI
ncbi:MAG: hypothetical protein LBF22_12975 [Deltaproteobacteria bacterium]|jgi:hypothetical protein|nr:hypothetical protein [Deltaproteobacteria bacterium]